MFEQGPVEEAASQPPAPRRAKIDSFDKEYIRRTIHNLYSQKRLPTIRIIQDEIKEQVTISNTKLKSVLKQLGFCWRRTEDNRRVAIERPESVAARAGFLREIRKFRQLGYQIVYTDETWVNQNHHQSYAWYPKLNLLDELFSHDHLETKLPNIPSGKGKRVVVLHAGSAEVGFIPDCDLVFVGTHDDQGDYHTEMNSVLFIEWFERLLKALDRPSVIVLDNASYHNARTPETRAPNMSAKKAVIRQWLQEKKIAHRPEQTKVELYQLLRNHKPQIVYQTDVMAAEMGHVTLRTPPRQCQLNAIELVWAQVKHYVAVQNTSMKIKDVVALTKEALAEVTQEKWHKVVQHTIRVEDRYWDSDGLMEEVAPVIIHLNDDDSTDSDDSDFED